MKHPDLALPWFTSQGWIIGIFLASLIVFHLVFVYSRLLSSMAWKRIDYIWLSMALIALVGAISAGRMSMANTLLSLAQAWVEGSLQFMHVAASAGTSGAICRVFVSSPFSPPADIMRKAQQEFDEECAWFKEVNAALQRIEPGNEQRVDLTQIARPRPSGGEESFYRSMEDSVQSYNESLDRLTELKRASEPSAFEELLRLLAPTVLAVALALRLTKVAGEIALERRKNNKEN